MNEYLEDEDNNDFENTQVKRGPGRPRIIRTGRAGRPTKQYNMIRTEPDESSITDATSSEDENVTSYEAEFATNAMEISFKEAVVGSDQEEWKDAIQTEIKNLVRNDTWKIVDKPAGAKVLGCRTVLWNKYEPDRSLKCRKDVIARVIAQGFAQRPRIDFNIDTFAPVARLSSLRLLVALSVEYDMRIQQLYVTSAFLN